MNEKNLASKRVATRPDTYTKLSLYADGLGVALTDAIEDMLAYVAERYGTDDLMDIGWQRRRAALLGNGHPRPGGQERVP